jgi:tRNA U55 pseudouridine synthase TruB
MARDGELEGVEMPAQMVTVESITDISTREISLREISRDVIDRISKVRGDFRQLETITAWKDLAQKHPEKTLTILTFTIAVSGGTYIRGIVHELGKKLYIPSSIWKLRRTKLAQFGFSLL